MPCASGPPARRIASNSGRGAANSIVGTSGSREGMYQPEGSLADFVGEDGRGTWTLTLAASAAVTGTLTNWSLSLR